MAMSIPKNYPAIVFIIVISLIETLAVIYATATYGAGLSRDSVEYIVVARNLSSGGGFTDHLGSAFVTQPPLFPIVLAVLNLIGGIDPADGARLLGALVAGGTVGLGSFLLFRFVRTPLALLGGVAILFGVPQIAVATYAWSEPLFNLLVLIFLTIVIRRQRLDRRAVVFLGVVTALACLTRYIGFSLVATGLVLILAQRDKLKTRLINSLSFGAISVLPVGIWLVRNWVVSGTLFGPRAPSRYSLFENLDYTCSSIFSWFLPDNAFPVCWMSIAVMIGVLAIIRKSRDGISSNAGLTRIAQPSLFIVTYASFLVITSTTTAYDRIDTRLLSPISIPLIIAFMFALDAASKWAGTLPRRPRLAIMVLAVPCALVFAIVPISETLLSVKAKAEQGAGGYNSRPWRQSETIAYLNKTSLQEEGTIYSNRADALYILAGIEAHTLPQRTYYNSDKPAGDLSSLAGKWPEHPGYLVYFDEGRSYHFDVGELSTIADVSLVMELSDAKIYTVSPR